MKKRVIIASMLSAFLACGVLAGCGSEGSKSPENAGVSSETEIVKEYVDEAQISELFTSPDNFSGKYVTLTGKIFAQPETDGDNICLQIFHDTEKSNQNFVVYGSSDQSVSYGDYVKIDGKISGTFRGENAFGGTVTCPLISDATIQKSSYIEVVHPTIKKISPKNASIEQHGLTLSIKKIEFAEKETRVYVEAKNQSSDKCYIDTYGATVIQGGKQISLDQSSMSQYEGDYDTLSYDLLASASDSGILVFPAMASNKDFTIHIDAHSDNYSVSFSPFVFNISGT